ncbi:MAG TPA: phosphopantetheine-binding protein [Actinomycetota bacterium]|nr:phosphopantetheine-binding protein [Actinomycetota bacterium]
MQRNEIFDAIHRFVATHLLGDDERGELTGSTPLLEWGVLNSMNTARLLGFVRDELGVTVPPQDIVGANFRDIDAIADLIADLRATQPVGA